MANTIPAGVICAWPGTAASIPAGWQRVTALDSLHTRGAAASTDPGTQGGSLSHSHGADAHTHGSVTLHTHSGGAQSSTVSNVVADTGSSSLDGIRNDHSHTMPATMGNASGSTGSTIAAWSTVTVGPPAFGVIFIRSDGTPTGFPVGAITFWPTSSLPAGWSQHAPSAGRYLVGAASRADGGTTSGSASHTHTSTAHGHSTGEHTHAAGATGTASGVSPMTVIHGAGTYVSPISHAHGSVSYGSNPDPTVTTQVAATMNADTYDPPFTTLVAITPASPDRPEGAVVVWTGTIAGIPFGWRICDGTNGTPDLRTSFVKAATVPSDAGTTGGAAGHTHTPTGTHTHTDNGHFHTGITAPDGAASATSLATSSINPNSDYLHSHSASSGLSAPTSGTLSAATADVQSAADTRPPFVDVAFLAAPGLLTVTITAPGNPVTTNNPTVTWTITGGHTQQSYVVTLYAADGVTVLYTSGLVASATQSAVIPAGHLHQGLTYIIDVQSFTTDFFLGDGSLTTVAAFTPSPTVTGVSATPEPSDTPPSVLVQWTQGTVSAGQVYVQTNIERRILGTTPWQQIGTLTAITTVSFRDYTAASGVTYEYAVTTSTNYSGDILRSAEQSPAPQATLSFLGIWLHIFGNPAVYLNYPANAGSLSRIQDQVNVPTWGRAIPTVHIGQQYWRTWTFEGIPIVYSGLPGAPGLPSAGTQDPWQQIDAFGLAAQQAGPDGVIVVRFGSTGEAGFGVVDFGGANQSAGSSGGQTGRKDELGVYTPTLVIDEQFVDTSV